MSGISRQASDVRFNEIDLSSTLQAYSSIKAAATIVSARGPLKPTYFTSYPDFTARCGAGSAKVSFDHLCIKDYFNEGSGVWINRAVNTDAVTAAMCLYIDSTGATQLGTTGVSDVDNIDWNAVAPSGATPLHVFFPVDGPGSYANNEYGIELVSQNLPKTTGVAITTSQTGGSLQPGSYQYRVSAFNASGEYLSSDLATVVIGSGSEACSNTVSWDAVDGAAGYYVYGRVSGNTFGRLATVGALNTSFVDDGLTTPDTDFLPVTSTAGLSAASPYFTLKFYLRSVNTSVAYETFDCSLYDELDGSGIQMETAERINAFSTIMGVVSNINSLLTTPRVASVGPTYMAEGASGSAPTTTQIINAQRSFLDKSKYIIDVLPNNGKSIVTIQKNLDDIAQKRADCVAFLDVPSTQQQFQKAVDFRNITLNLNSSYSALFGPDLLEYDAVSGKNIYVPPSGNMASLLCRTTRVAKPWHSMAGLNRGLTGALDVRYTFDDEQATILFQSQINYMRKFLGQGIPLWEQTTLYAKSSALQYINVRVLLNVIKRSVYSYLIWTLQEQTTDDLMKTISDNLNNYLDSVKAGNGLREESRAYCNKNTTTALDSNQGTTKVVVYLVPILANRAIAVTMAIGKSGLVINEADIAAAA